MAAETAIDYGVRVLKPFGQFSIGDHLFPTGIYRDALIRRGWVQAVKPPEVADVLEKPTRNRIRPENIAAEEPKETKETK